MTSDSEYDADAQFESQAQQSHDYPDIMGECIDNIMSRASDRPDSSFHEQVGQLLNEMQNLSRVGRAAPAGQNRIVPSAKTLLPRALRILKANETRSADTSDSSSDVATEKASLNGDVVEDQRGSTELMKRLSLSSTFRTASTASSGSDPVLVESLMSIASKVGKFDPPKNPLVTGSKRNGPSPSVSRRQPAKKRG